MNRRGVPLGVVVGSMQRGGTETHLAEVLPMLRQRGFAPAVFVLGADGPVAAELRAKGVPVHPARPFHMPARLALLGRILRLAWLVPRLLAFGFAHRGGLLHAFLPQAVIVTFCLFWPWRRRLLVSQRGQFTYRARHSRLTTWVERLALRHAAAVLTNSAALATMLRQDGTAPERIRVIANGLGPARLSPSLGRAESRALLGLADDGLVLVTLANLHGYKGHADILRALGLLQQRGALPGHWQWVAIGADPATPPALPGLVALAAELRLGAHVRFLGGREDAPRLLPAADIGIHASHEEGMPNAVLEMMGAGLPIVATAAGGTAEALDGGQAGMVVPVAAPAALADALEALLRDAALRQRLGAAARRRALACYSLGRCVTAYAALYADLLQRPRTMPGAPLSPLG